MEAPEVTAVLASLPFLGVLYGSAFFIWWKITKSNDTY